MDYRIEKLDKKHFGLIATFSCIENDELLKRLNSKNRRRIKRHSKEIDIFLKNEALDEQGKGLNTTHLFIDNVTQQIIGFVSLCNDAIKLELEEKNIIGVKYANVPAIKIARLGVSNQYQRQGIGKQLIDYSVYSANRVKELSGVTYITLDCYRHRMSYYKTIGFTENIIQQNDLSADLPISMRLSLNSYLSKYERA